MDYLCCPDNDNDGYSSQQGGCGTVDCDDGDDQRYPGNTEICDNKDNDCDNIVDDGLSRQCGIDVGECSYGIETCSAGSWGGCNAVMPSTEICDNKDNDCDGNVDEDMDGDEYGLCDRCDSYDLINLNSWELGEISPEGVAVDSNDNKYVVGCDDDRTNSEADAIIIKYDSNDNILWQRVWDYNGALDCAKAIYIDDNDNIFVAGSGGNKWPSGASYSDVSFLLKYDSVGNLIWSNTHDKIAGDQEYVYNLISDSVGNIYGVGKDESKTMLFKYDSAGNLVCDNYINLDVGEPASGSSVAIDSTGEIYVGDHYGYQANLLKFNSDCDFKEGFFLPSFSGFQDVRDIKIDDNGNFYVAGSSQSEGYLIKYDSSFDKIWHETFDYSPYYIELTLSEIFVIGRRYIDNDARFSAFDFEGNLLWIEETNLQINPGEIAVDSDKNLYFTIQGPSVDYPTHNGDFVKLVCVKSEQCNGIDDTGEEDIDEGCYSCQNDEWFEVGGSKYCFDFRVVSSISNANSNCQDHEANLASYIDGEIKENIVEIINKYDEVSDNQPILNPTNSVKRGLFVTDDCCALASSDNSDCRDQGYDDWEGIFPKNDADIFFDSGSPGISCEEIRKTAHDGTDSGANGRLNDGLGLGGAVCEINLNEQCWESSLGTLHDYYGDEDNNGECDYDGRHPGCSRGDETCQIEIKSIHFNGLS